jgi:hypothetical protein
LAATLKPVARALRSERATNVLEGGDPTVKILTTIALALFLAACGVGATTPSEVSLPPIGESSASASASADATADGSPTSMSCTEAFANIDTNSVIAMGSLDAVSDELDSTIAACSSADDWEAAAETALSGLDIADPQSFIAARCAEATALADAPICAEVGS